MTKPYIEISYNSDEEWHEIRKHGIGGSDAGIVLGLNKYKTPYELWEEKTGLRESDFKGNEATERGTAMEEHLRAIFAIVNKNIYKVEYKKVTYQSTKYPWMFVNLDGELVRLEDGKKGVLEIKTSSIQNKAMLDDWGTEKEPNVPMTYLCQILHAMVVTDSKFAIIYAWLNIFGKEEKLVTRTISYEDHLEDIELLIKKESEFWNHVETKQAPAFATIKLNL